MLELLLLVTVIFQACMWVWQSRKLKALEDALCAMRRDFLKSNFAERKSREDFDEAAYWREERGNLSPAETEEKQEQKEKKKAELNLEDRQVIQEILAEYLG